MEWAWARANTEYTTEASGADLNLIGKGILSNYSSADKPQDDVESVRIHTDITEVSVGENLWLSADVLPETADGRLLTWSSSNPGIASVDEDGVVTANAKGTVTITAEAKNGNGVSDSITLTVLGAKVKAIELTAEKTTLKTGENVQIHAVVRPEYAENKEIGFQSSNSGVASVSGKGLVTAKAAGTAVITAEAAFLPAWSLQWNRRRIYQIRIRFRQLRSIRLRSRSRNRNLRSLRLCQRKGRLLIRNHLGCALPHLRLPKRP